MTGALAAIRAVPVSVWASLAIGCAAFSSAWIIQGWRKDAEIAELKAARTALDLENANRALLDLRTAGETIRQKADEFRGIQSTMHTELAAFREDLKNATPLPSDCRPDDQRLRNLTGAVRAAQQAAAAR